jgi:CubicO group peptidase (beta-lactamase class C family)
VGELVRRITGKSLGAFFREEVAVPLNADFHIGLHKENDYRVAELIPPPALKPGNPGYKLFNDPGSISEVCKKVMTNPPTDAYAVLCTRDWAWRAAEIPAANGHGNARSVARVGAAIACGGELDGVRLVGRTTIEKAIEEQDYGTDLVLGGTFRRGLGFILNSKEMPMGPNPHTFYGSGWGGSKMVVDLDAELSWSYVMNKMGNLSDPRTQGIIQALYAAL